MASHLKWQLVCKNAPQEIRKVACTPVHDSISVRPRAIQTRRTQEPIGQKRERKTLHRFSARILDNLTVGADGRCRQL
jgi:hypothetical protein